MAKPDSDSDTVAMLHAWHGGDRASLLRLIERDATWIQDMIRRRRRHEARLLADTADQFQDLMVEVLEFVPRFMVANRHQFRGLLLRILENDLIDQARRLDRRQHMQAAFRETLHESRLDLSHSVGNPQKAAAHNEELAWMRLGLEFLSTEDRRIIEARQFGGEEFTAIAKRLEADPNTVRMRFNRSLVKLSGIVRQLQNGDLDSLLESDE